MAGKGIFRGFALACLCLVWTFLLVACMPPAATPEAAGPATPAVTSPATPSQGAEIAIPTSTPRARISPTPTVEAGLDAFIASLQAGINSPNFSRLRSVMSDPFVLDLHPSGREVYEVEEAFFRIRSRYLPEDPAVTVSNLDTAADPPPMQWAETVFGNERPLAAIIQSSGWGLSGTGEGLLFIVEEQGEYRWAGLLVSYEAFAPYPALEVVPPPPGLVYRIEDQYWLVGSGGEPQLLIEHPGQLSLNPGATLAIYAESEAQTVTVFQLPGDEDQKVIELGATLLHGSWQLPWLDDRTAVVVVAPGQQIITQGSTGLLSLLDVVDGRLSSLGPELSLHAQPAVAPAGTIVYDDAASGQPELWRDGIQRPLEVGGLQIDGMQSETFFNPVLSPDGTRLAGLVTGDFGRHTFAYVVIDLSSGAGAVVHTFLPVPTDAVLPWGIAWSPDGRRLALEPPSWDPVENGVWLVTPDGETRAFLGTATSSPVWIDGDELILTATTDGVAWLQRLDLVSGERAWLDLPAGARAVQSTGDSSG